MNANKEFMQNLGSLITAGQTTTYSGDAGRSWA